MPDRQAYQAGGRDFTVEEPKGDNEEVILLWIHPHLKHTKKKCNQLEFKKNILYTCNLTAAVCYAISKS